MVSELTIQKNIVEAFKKAGGIGVKWPSGFTVGWPDLWLGVPNQDSFWMEVKHLYWNANNCTWRVSKIGKIQTVQINRILTCTGTIAMIGGVYKEGQKTVVIPTHPNFVNTSDINYAPKLVLNETNIADWCVKAFKFIRNQHERTKQS